MNATCRQVLSSVTAGAAALPGAAYATVHPAADARPNILWIVIEDNFPYLGAYGDPALAFDENSGRAHWRNRPEGAPFAAMFTLMINHK